MSGQGVSSRFGQRGATFAFCAALAVACAGCPQFVGDEYYLVDDADGIAWCHREMAGPWIEVCEPTSPPPGLGSDVGGSGGSGGDAYGGDAGSGGGIGGPHGSASGGQAGAPAAAPTCSDATMNQDETDVDCGGECPPCDLGQSCQHDDDCADDLECHKKTCERD